MDRVEDIERQVQALSPGELAQFRAWFLEFDSVVWDRRIDRDVRAGRLDALAERTLDERAIRRPQGPRSGVNAILGRLATPESDDEIIEALERLS